MKQKLITNNKINRQITAKEVRLINEEKEMLGVFTLDEALKKAQEKNLDLIEIAGDKNPAICKIGDYSKMKYHAQKKAKEMHKNAKAIVLKEIAMSHAVGKGDYDTKIRHMIEFFKKGHKVKVTFKFKGREVVFANNTFALCDKMIEELAEYAKVDSAPKLEGKRMSFTLSALVVKNEK